MTETFFVKKTSVFCYVQFASTHSWPECPFDEVAFLRSPHRHIFHIKGYKRVNHDDRDVEFILLKNRVEEYLNEQYPKHDLGRTSCESLANELSTVFGFYKCEVSEDNENGAIVEYETVERT